MSDRRWMVKLIGSDLDLRSLHRVLSRAQVQVVQEDDTFYFASPDFEAFHDASAVYLKARDALPSLNWAGVYNTSDFKGVRLAEVVEIEVDGNRKVAHMLEAEFIINIGVSAELSTTVSTGSQIVAPRTVTELAIEMSSEDDAVRRVMRLWSDKPLDWVNLYRIFEIIRYDARTLRSAKAKDLASSKEAKRFTHSADNPEVSGDDSRHGTRKYDPPRDPMTLQQARGFVRRLFETWIRAKSDARNLESA
jgi:hypothetical protein